MGLFHYFGQSNYSNIENFFKTFFGKFLIISLCWTFSFQILNEIRHLFWDAGFGFDLKIAKITGIIALIGSFILTILFYVLGEIYFKCIHSTKKWLFTKISSLILIPLMVWFLINFVSIYDKVIQK